MSLNHLVFPDGKHSPLDIQFNTALSGDLSIGTEGGISGLRFKQGEPAEFNVFVATSGGGRFRIQDSTSTGVFLRVGDTSWTATSDQTRKKNIQQETNLLDRLSNISCYLFDLKTDNRDDSHRIGLLAQEVKQYFPRVVSDYEDDEGPTMGIRYTELVTPLIGAVNELKARLDIANARIEALESA